MRSDAEKVQYAVSVLEGAVQSGVVRREQVEEHLAVLREGEATPITITLNVTGDLSTLRRYASETGGRIERALAGVAREAGLTVQTGSAQVSV